MADFARVLAAVDQVLGTDGFARFTEQARTMAEDSLSSDPFLARMAEMGLDFKGKAAELLVKVTPDQDKWRPPRDSPKGARSVTGLLKRNAPALRKAGWIVEAEEDADHFTIWTVIRPEKVGNPSPFGPSSPSAPDQTEKTENQYGQSQDDQAVPAFCSKCGDSFSQPGLTKQCKPWHQGVAS